MNTEWYFMGLNEEIKNERKKERKKDDWNWDEFKETACMWNNRLFGLCQEMHLNFARFAYLPFEFAKIGKKRINEKPQNLEAQKLNILNSTNPNESKSS